MSPRLRQAWPMVVALVAFVITLTTDGPLMLNRDGHWLQRLSAVFILALAAAAYRLPLTPAARLFFSAAGAWLAVDETLTVHECLKSRFHLSRFGGDPLVIVYGVGGLIGLLVLIKLLGATRLLNRFTALSVFGAVCAVAGDVLPSSVLPRAALLIIEEGGEFLAVTGALALLESVGPMKANRIEAWGVTSLLAGLYAVPWLTLRPDFCPPQLQPW